MSEKIEKTARQAAKAKPAQEPQPAPEPQAPAKPVTVTLLEGILEELQKLNERLDAAMNGFKPIAVTIDEIAQLLYDHPLAQPEDHPFAAEQDQQDQEDGEGVDSWPEDDDEDGGDEDEDEGGEDAAAGEDAQDIAQEMADEGEEDEDQVVDEEEAAVIVPPPAPRPRRAALPAEETRDHAHTPWKREGTAPITFPYVTQHKRGVKA